MHTGRKAFEEKRLGALAFGFCERADYQRGTKDEPVLHGYFLFNFASSLRFLL